MAQECGFFNAHLVGEEYDRVYLAEQFAAYFASFIGNGIYGKSMQKLEIISQDTPNMTVKVLSGEAWVNGWWYRNKDAYVLNIPIADGVLSRIDAVILRWGSTERDMWLDIIVGEPSANPQVPTIRRDADYYDLMLGYINISAGSIKITQAQITDTRLDNSVCGLVTGVIDQIDTTDLYNQFTAYFDEFKQNHEADFDEWSEEQKQEYLTYIAYQKGLYDKYIADTKGDYDAWTTERRAEFDNWFDNVKDVLDQDAAGHLLNLINGTKDEIDEEVNKVKEQLSTWEIKFIGHESKKTEFNPDGSITVRYSDQSTLTTTFNADSSISETLRDANGTILSKKTTTFNSDNSISEIVEDLSEEEE